MQITLPRVYVSVIIIAFLGAAIAAAAANVAKPIPVEFRHVGDDGLSERLADKVESAFKQSPDFALSSGRQPGTLMVTIPTNVDWNDVGKKTQVLYTVEFSVGDNRKISLRKGSCWEDELSKCAAQIVKDAKIAAREIRRE